MSTNKRFSVGIGVFLIYTLLTSLISCNHKTQVVKPLQSSCDSTNVSYSGSVVPILRNNCYSCHSTSAAAGGGGLDLEDFTSFKSYLKNSYRGDTIYGSKFFHIIAQTQGTLPMPPTGKLSFCEIRKIENWIEAGALFN